MKCANCTDAAIYVYEGPGVRDTPYCLTCLPSFVKPLVKAKAIKTTELYESTKTDVLAKLAPEPVEDEPVVEAAPAPKRRRRKVADDAEPAVEEQAEV